jgi:hypothetical protein
MLRPSAAGEERMQCENHILPYISDGLKLHLSERLASSVGRA